MDRWNIVTTLNYLPAQAEANIVLSKIPAWDTEEGERRSHRWCPSPTYAPGLYGELSIVMSPRTVILGSERGNLQRSRLCLPRVLLNKCDETERTIVAEYYQRCLGEDLTDASAALALKALEK